MGKSKLCPNCSASSNTHASLAFSANDSLDNELGNELGLNANFVNVNPVDARVADANPANANPVDVSFADASPVDASFENLNSPLPLAPKLDISVPKKRKPRLGPVLPPPEHSTCLYVQISPKDIAMFKFLLEAEDNLGYMSVVDRWSAALKVVYSPHQQKAMQAWLASTAKALQFKEIWLNRG